MNRNLELYNAAYKHMTPDFISTNKLDAHLELTNDAHFRFLSSFCAQFPEINFYGKDILEVGCGAGGLIKYFNDKNALYTGFDFSNMAISIARDYQGFRALSGEYVCGSVCSGIHLGKTYDFIFDSHLLHCLTGEDRKKYFEFIKKHLASDGRFICESMVFQKGLKLPVGYSFNESSEITKEVSGGDIPIRKLLKFQELENEFKTQGLIIDYLYYHSELSINPFIEYSDYPVSYLPHTARLSVRLG